MHLTVFFSGLRVRTDAGRMTQPQTPDGSRTYAKNQSVVNLETESVLTGDS